MMRNYKEARGILRKKYRNIFGKYIFVIEENGTKTKIIVGKSIYELAKIGSSWTIGHLDGQCINIRPESCDHSGKC